MSLGYVQPLFKNIRSQQGFFTALFESVAGLVSLFNMQTPKHYPRSHTDPNYCTYAH